MKTRLLFAALTMTVYIVCPAYRYWALGSWMAYRIITDIKTRRGVVAK